ncbi:Dyp-type peroxidase [Microbacterium sp. RU33B]|uniref:Dyp-type peroxidase n=1 Tax=Microbacterium sp. RU33B TaxID=1907390 RepID=UPI000969EEF5|nr:Dyp-type peroxidase [Microbacterium sp. RU33B]SIT69326.1 dye decolorizing peroxidase [Microbacterium sp. RU33B]
MSPDRDARSGRRGSTRRQFLLGGAVAGVGAAAAVGIDYAIRNPAAAAGAPSTPLNGTSVVPFHGVHQAGVDTDAQAHGLFIALDLLPDVDRDGLRRMMSILTDDAARLTQGDPALADSEPELATSPARLTVTFGFGAGFVARAQHSAPTWLKPLPAFAVDRLQPEFGDGDLLLQIASDDPLTVAHAGRMLLKDARSFAAVRWTQRGFRRAHGTVKPGTTMRNLFGQVDGTSNPSPGTAEFDAVVWNDDGWLAGGTSAVVRRIRMDLDKWDRLDRGGRDQSVGRFQSTGAPLTGVDEFDEPDFDVTTAVGFPVIPEFSHLRRARSENPEEKIFRRAYNYDDAPVGGGVSNAGLIFVSFQADVDRQFVPIQRRLDELDLLNEWTTPIGSAVFAIPPGCAPGGFIGETLLT